MASQNEESLGLVPVPEQGTFLRRRPTGNRELAQVATPERVHNSGQVVLSNSLVVAIKQQSPTDSDTMSLPQQPPVRPAASSHAAVAASQKSTCLLCADPVLISNEDAKSKAAIDRNAMIKTLCFHVQMESKEVPKYCTAEMFPFCTVCQRQVMQLWENEKIVQEAHKKISKNIAIIERTVADAELLRATMKMTTVAEEKKFVKLRDRILDGYRTKLIMKQKMRESLVLGSEMKIRRPGFSHTLIMDSSSINRQFGTGRTTSTTPRRMGDENISANASPMDTGTTPTPGPVPDDGQQQQQDRQSETATTGNDRESGTGLPKRSVHFQLQPSPSQQRQQEFATPSTIKKSTNTAAWVASAASATAARLVGKYNENSCSMLISDVRSDTASPAPPATLAFIKQEPIDSLTPAPVPAGKRKRRSLFQGIEILRVTDLQTNKIYLQCSICRFKAQVTGYSTGSSPYQTMTTHITEKHLGKKRRAALAAGVGQVLPTRRQFACQICSKAFETKKGLADHNMTHLNSPKVVSPATPTIINSSPHPSYIQDLECDICGRPVKGNQSNLLAHKFSHKNNDERLAAMAAGEKGSRPALLRPQQQKRRRAAPTFSVKRVRKGKSKIINTSAAGRRGNALKENSDSTTGAFKCQVCFRVFLRNCHLALHMQGHARRSMMPVPPSKKSQTPIPEKRRRSTATDQQPANTEESSQEQDNLQQDQNVSPPANLDETEGAEQLFDDQMETDDNVESNANENSSELTVGATS